MKVAGMMAVVALLSTQGIWESGAQTSRQPVESEREALMLMRTVNTAQAELRRARPTVADLEELLTEPLFKELFPNAAATKSGTAVLGAYTVTFVRDETQTRYQAMVTAGERCSSAFFTNESGLIYRGRALGCDQ